MHALSLEDGSHSVVAANLSLVIRILQITRLDVLPDLFDALGTGELGFAIEELGERRGEGERFLLQISLLPFLRCHKGDTNMESTASIHVPLLLFAFYLTVVLILYPRCALLLPLARLLLHYFPPLVMAPRTCSRGPRPSRVLLRLQSRCHGRIIINRMAGLGLLDLLLGWSGGNRG